MQIEKSPGNLPSPPLGFTKRFHSKSLVTENHHFTTLKEMLRGERMITLHTAMYSFEFSTFTFTQLNIKQLFEIPPF